jgi:phage terminase small subunit
MLTPKQEIFANEYLIDLNATRAYKVAYPKIKNDETAGVNGCRLLKNARVSEYIRERMLDRQKRTEVTQDWVVEQLYKIAAADRSGIANVVTKERLVTAIDAETGELKQVPGVSQFVEIADTDTLDDAQKAALSGVEETKHGIKVNTYDKLKALELLGRHLGMFTDKMELSADEDFKVTITVIDG